MEATFLSLYFFVYKGCHCQEGEGKFLIALKNGSNILDFGLYSVDDFKLCLQLPTIEFETDIRMAFRLAFHTQRKSVFQLARGMEPT